MRKTILLLLFFSLVSCGYDKEQNKELLPWKASNNADGTTHVLGVDIGKTSFKDLMFKLKLLAEPALFESKQGDLSLEAYFGKKKFGILEARLVAEMDADEALLKQFLKEQAGRDSTPSNHWKYKLNIKNTRLANDLRVWRLIYLPVADYDLKQMKFFGEPEEKIKITDTAEYWLYPSRGMVLLYDTAGKEIFYYVAKKDFKRLKDSLPTKPQILAD